MSKDQTTEDLGAARIEGRAPALRPSVPLYRHMLYGTGLSNALDHLALSHIHYMCEDGKSFSVDDLVEALRHEGILAANGKGLVGSKAVYQSVARLRDVGFLHRTQENGGTFGKVSYTFYEFPSMNPHWAPAGGSGEGPGEPLGLTGETVRKLLNSNHVSAGQTASPDRASADRASADRRSGFPDISAGQAASPDRRNGNAAPPTPPYREEEDSSSLKSSSITGVSTGAQATDAAAVTAAAEFLAELPGKWACGRKSAGELGPLLAEAVAVQGWELGSDLVQLLTRRVTGRRSALSALRDRIEDLPRYHRARKSLEAERARAARDGAEQPALLPGAPAARLTANEGQAPAEPAAAAALPASVSAEQVEEARKLLLSLTNPWTPDPQTAARLAPVLAAVTAERGWDLGEALRQQLMSNPGGGQNYTWLLEHKRIAALPDRSAARKPKAVPAGMCGLHPWYPAGECATCVMRAAAQRKAAEAEAEAGERTEETDEGQTPPVQGRSLSELFAAMRQPTF
ncbi:hypothetical protein ACFWEH_38070 [Streptomyces anulatus]|uniref:hypothetical protein n=1 Tax=Streptomyces anulatus TaxID=1892 RepID=UPI00366A047C